MSKLKGARVAFWALLGALFLFSTTALAEQPVENGEQGEGQAAETTQRRAEGPTPKLFVLPVDSLEGAVSQIVTERINDALRRQLDSDRRVELRPTYREIVGGTGENPFAVVAEAEKLYTSAIGMLRAGNHERAAETFQRAVDMIEANLGGLQNFNVLTDALVNLSLAYFKSGFDLDARQYMQRYAQLRPEATLDPNDFPADLREVFESEVNRVRSAETGLLTIEADREGVMVFINGVLKGQAPLVVDDVGFGHHYLVVRDADTVWSELIRVRARGQEQTFVAELDAVGTEEQVATPSFYDDLRENLRTGRFGAGLSPYLVELSQQTDAGFLAWVLIVRDGSQYIAAPFVYRARDGMVIQGENVSFNLELSNLRSRVTQLAAIVSSAVSQMPEERAVIEVDLLPQPEPRVEVQPRDEEQVGSDGEQAVEEHARVDDDNATTLPVPRATPRAGDTIAELDPIAEEERRRRMRYVGYGGAAALASGVIVGTVILLVRGSNAEAGFEAEVQW